MQHETPLLRAIPTRPKPSQVLEELGQIFKQPPRTLWEFVNVFAFDGIQELLHTPVRVIPIFREALTSGYNFCYDEINPASSILASIRLGVTTSNYFVVQTLLKDGTSNWISHYYTSDGKYAFSEGPITHYFTVYPDHRMEEKCPVVDFLYQVLASDYLAAQQGSANTTRAHLIETILQRLKKTRSQDLSVSKSAKDPAIRAINDQMNRIEKDPIYTWDERFRIYSTLKANRSQIIRTKKRAHRKSFLSYSLFLFLADSLAATHRFFLRPINNLIGLLDYLFIGPLRWFFGMIRKNMGMSIAMAIYSPFTFFFITQPLNPHATYAVGKVRTAYIEGVEKMVSLFEGEKLAPLTTGAATAGAAITATTAVTSASTVNSSTTQNRILLSTDVPAVNDQTWDERMSNFKAMQIEYESNLEITSRFGRLEQMETQLNWPLIVENAWIQMERYLQSLQYYVSNQKQYPKKFNDYVQAEIARTQEAELYLWDRNVRFILDHPYTMMDQSNEQTQMDYYVGKSFVFLREMTRTLAARVKGLETPKGFDQIMILAQKFDALRSPKSSPQEDGILNRLKNNSKLFGQKDVFNTTEMRSYMKRHWEVLYLLQNHAQEGSNMALQLYVWSIRNAVWILQSLYTIKNADVSQISIALGQAHSSSVNKLSQNAEFNQNEAQIEALFHLMVLEYTSIRKEIGEALKKDIETKQRKTLIESIQTSIKEREALLKETNLL